MVTCTVIQRKAIVLAALVACLGSIPAGKVALGVGISGKGRRLGRILLHS